MSLKVSGVNIDITPAIREYVERKFDKIMRHTDNVISTTVTLSVDKLNNKAEVDMHLAGKTFHVECVELDMYASVDMLADKLDRMVLKHKEKNTAHRANPSGRESVNIEPTVVE